MNDLEGDGICKVRQTAGVKYPQHIFHWDGKIRRYRCDFCRVWRQPQPDKIMSSDSSPVTVTTESP